MSSANRRNVLAGLTMGAGGLLANVAMSAEPSRMPGNRRHRSGFARPGPRSAEPRSHQPPSADLFKSSYYADISLNQWLALAPQDLLKAHWSPDQQLTQVLRKQKAPIIPV